MHRFRRKSDAKRSADFSNLSLNNSNFLPQLPQTDDFRTSLILPDLSRRFSLLRFSTGEPVSLDHLKSKLADQRARGAENHITEEEEEMLLETLGRFRSKLTHTPQQSQENITEGDEASKNPVKSSDISVSSATSSPTSRSAKRYSNNLFGSGRLRDYNYLRSTGPTKGSVSSTRTTSLTPTESSVKNSASSFRPTTPDNSSLAPSSAPSSPDDKRSVSPSPAGLTIPPGEMQSFAEAELSLQNVLGPSRLKRASMAVGSVLKELEDEADDEILLPRTGPTHRDQPSSEPGGNGNASNTNSVYEAGMAISIDQTIQHEFHDRRASPIPARTQAVPGYVPGMPRPMTPRDFDFDEVRSHSTTPRAQSPYHDPSSQILNPISTIKARRGSTSSVNRPSPSTPTSVAPLFLQRSTNGRFTPTADDSSRSGDVNDPDSPLSSSILSRRRPASPLASPPFQPLAVSSRPPSRPSTPSNVVWTVNPNLNGNGRHSRNNSWTGENSLNDFQTSLTGQSRSEGGRLRSPPLPESSRIDATQGATPVFSSATGVNSTKDQSASSDRPYPYIPSVDLGSPILAAFHAPRSPTPTQQSNSNNNAAQRSPTSPAFPNFDMRNGSSRRSSRQNAPSSPFNVHSFPMLGSLPIANSSRSSLDSVGSSFHSWDEPDKVLTLFNDSKEQQSSPWHDFDADKSSVTLAEDEDDLDAEDIIMKYAGLKEGDIVAVQHRLVTAAIIRAATDPRDRAPSALRRRRPSTSQSNYSRIASPLPQVQPPAPYSSDDQYSKANALLNSVVESIKDQPPPLTTTIAPAVSQQEEISPNTRRNRDLAQVLFGDEDIAKEDADDTITSSTTSSSFAIRQEPTEPKKQEPTLTTTATTSLPATLATITPRTQPTTPLPAEDPKISAQPTISPYLLTRNPSTHKIPQTPQAQADLAQEVQRKTDAATLALKKAPSKSDPHANEGLARTTSIRKRIDPSQISTPRLVSASTSVDTIPLRSPSLTANNNNGTSKLGSRFKKLRGSLRVKNPVASSGEETVTPVNLRSPITPTQLSIRPDPAKVNNSSNAPGPGTPSSTPLDTGRFNVSVPSPPASAGPGLKGFMARFRNKQRASEMPSGASNAQRLVSPVPVPPVTPTTPRPTDARHSLDRPLTPRTGGQRPMYSRFPPASPAQLAAAPPRPTTPSRPATPSSASNVQPQAQPVGHHYVSPSIDSASQGQSGAALEQLLAAAKDLGLDTKVINDILATQSNTAVGASSASSKNVLAGSNSTTTVPKTPTSNNGSTPQAVSYVGSSSSEQTATPTDYKGSSATASNVNGRAKDATPPPPAEGSGTTRGLSIRKNEGQRRPPKEGQADPASNAIVRRTIVYANDTNLSATDFAAMVQRKNSARRKRASTQSVTSRSVVDRAPTPPPSKVPAAKRFSTDMPPMPQLPNSYGQPTAGNSRLIVPSASPAGRMEKSNSTHDSFYDMYAEESRAASMAVIDSTIPTDQQSTKGDGLSVQDPGPVLEVIELANGETIWNVVNGLRDYEEESIYTGRTSFASEYSNVDDDDTQTPKQFPTGEHSRSASKGSIPSVSKRKPSQQGQQGKLRPETKVYYSSSAQIGRLIESLSQGVDAGSFNFRPNGPNQRPGHSASSSLSTNDMDWTVEERLDHLLGDIHKP